MTYVLIGFASIAGFIALCKLTGWLLFNVPWLRDHVHPDKNFSQTFEGFFFLVVIMAVIFTCFVVGLAVSAFTK